MLKFKTTVLFKSKFGFSFFKMKIELIEISCPTAATTPSLETRLYKYFFTYCCFCILFSEWYHLNFGMFVSITHCCFVGCVKGFYARLQLLSYIWFVSLDLSVLALKMKILKNCRESSSCDHIFYLVIVNIIGGCPTKFDVE